VAMVAGLPGPGASVDNIFKSVDSEAGKAT
jgi:hypothetical protein